MYGLGNCYKFGHGVDANESKAFEWYMRSAEKDSRYGEIALGRCYEEGFGCVKDGAKAFELYNKAYTESVRKEHMSLRTVKLFKDSADAGNALGMFFLALCYENGTINMFEDGTQKDISKAIELYKKSKEASKDDCLTKKIDEALARLRKDHML